MVSILLLFHTLMFVVSGVIILIILFLLLRNWRYFIKLDNYRIIVFLSSLAIAIGSHEIVYYNYIQLFNLKQFFS
jgi:hypothetical protein